MQTDSSLGLKFKTKVNYLCIYWSLLRILLSGMNEVRHSFLGSRFAYHTHLASLRASCSCLYQHICLEKSQNKLCRHTQIIYQQTKRVIRQIQDHRQKALMKAYPSVSRTNPCFLFDKLILKTDEKCPNN